MNVNFFAQRAVVRLKKVHHIQILVIAEPIYKSESQCITLKRYKYTLNKVYVTVTYLSPLIVHFEHYLHHCSLLMCFNFPDSVFIHA